MPDAGSSAPKTPSAKFGSIMKQVVSREIGKDIINKRRQPRRSMPNSDLGPRRVRRQCSPRVVLEVGRRVDLGRGMVALEGALERRPPAGRAAGFRLLHCVVAASSVVHQSIVLIRAPLAAPDPPGDQGDSGQDDGPSHTDHDADHGVARLWRHARGAALR